MTKKIYVNHYAPTVHSMYFEMFRNPPNWFEYVLKSDLESPVVNSTVNKIYALNKSDLFWKFNKKILSKIINTVKIKDFLYPLLVIPRTGMNLVYSLGYVVKKNVPWIIDMETVHVLNGYDIPDLEKNREYYGKILKNHNCKGIVVWNSCVRDSVSNFFRDPTIDKKIKIIRHTIRDNEFEKKIREKKAVNLLFLGSANILRASYVRWIIDALEIYKKIARMNPNVTLTIAPFLPKELERKYGGVPWIRSMGKILNREEMSELYSEMDILLHPSYSNPAMTLLEAMNFWLSIVTTDYSWLSDLVKDGVNGFICKNNSRFEYYGEHKLPRSDIGEMVELHSGKDAVMIDDFVEKTMLLVNSTELRRQFAKAWKKTLQEGEYSFWFANTERKKLYESALKV